MASLTDDMIRDLCLITTRDNADDMHATDDARDRFAEYLERASETVRTWPLWKQTVLGSYQTSPTEMIPRRSRVSG